MDKRLLQAYRAAHYTFEWNGRTYILEIGKRSSDLQQVFHAFDCNKAAYITPQNPFSRQLSDEANSRLLSEFETILNGEGYSYLEGIGQDPNGDWPGEHSFLILNISREAASSFAHQYGQNAYVFCSQTFVPELMVASTGAKEPKYNSQ